MDPVTAAGVALSVAGIAGQVFTGCIQCIQLVITAIGLPQECRYLVLRLRMEQQRLFAWSEASGLLDFDPAAADNSKLLEANVFGLHRSTLLDLLVQIKVLFEDFENHQRRNQRLDARQDVEEQTPQEGLLSLPSKRKAFIERAMKAISNKSSESMTRLRWVAFDKDGFENLLQKFSTLNDSMTGLLDARLQNEIYNTTQDTNRSVLQLARDLADLQQLVKAALVLTIRNQSSLLPAPTTNAVEKRSGLDLLTQLARFKAFNKSIELGQTDYTSFQELDLPEFEDKKIQLHKSDVELLDFDQSIYDIESSRSEAIYHRPDGNKQSVWIEWKEYDWQPLDEQPVPQLVLERVHKLVQLLHHQPKPQAFRVPRCIGYFDNASHDEDSEDDLKIGFVFEKPLGAGHDVLPTSLLDLMHTYRKPRITDRVSLASAIATCILHLHSVNWLHKGLRSHNIVFFPRRDQATHTDVVDYSQPYISGFDFARPAHPGEQTEIPVASIAHEIYRHPSTQSSSTDSRETYRRTFDIYSLGVILVELAFWQPVDKILDIDVRSRKTKARVASGVRSRLLSKDMIEEVGANMGAVYEDVTRKCLTGGEELGLDPKDDETDDHIAAKLSRVFYDDVVQRLESIHV